MAQPAEFSRKPTIGIDGRNWTVLERQLPKDTEANVGGALSPDLTGATRPCISHRPPPLPAQHQVHKRSQNQLRLATP